MIAREFYELCKKHLGRPAPETQSMAEFPLGKNNLSVVIDWERKTIWVDACGDNEAIAAYEGMNAKRAAAVVYGMTGIEDFLEFMNRKPKSWAESFLESQGQ